MYNISEFSKKTNTSIQTLRYYDNLKILRPSKIGEYNNYRYYSDDELVKIKTIKKLKKMGFTLKEIYVLLNDYNEEHLLKHKKILENNVKEDLESIKQIDKMIGKINNNLDFQNELVNLLNNEERKEINMKERYSSAKNKLLKCYELYKNDNFLDCITSLEELKMKYSFPLMMNQIHFGPMLQEIFLLE